MIGNLDYNHSQKRVTVKVPGVKKKGNLKAIYSNSNYKTRNNKIIADLEPAEIKVLRLHNFSL